MITKNMMTSSIPSLTIIGDSLANSFYSTSYAARDRACCPGACTCNYRDEDSAVVAARAGVVGLAPGAPPVAIFEFPSK